MVRPFRPYSRRSPNRSSLRISFSRLIAHAHFVWGHDHHSAAGVGHRIDRLAPARAAGIESSETRREYGMLNENGGAIAPRPTRLLGEHNGAQCNGERHSYEPGR